MKNQSKTFCVYPWMHLHATPMGKINYCCISMRSHVKTDEGKDFDLSKDKMTDAWNSQYMRDLRRSMLAGEKIKGCETCYKQEEFGQRSHRQNYNDEWASKTQSKNIEEIVERSIKDDFFVNSNPMHLDLRLGSLCNLRCRMCSPQNSTQIEKEWKELDQQTNYGYSNFWNEPDARNWVSSKWYENPHFWENLESLAPGLRKVYVAGGEPLLLAANKKFLQYCVDQGFASNIELFVNTNMTILNDEWLEIFCEFKDVGINASIDGFGVINEYIRNPSHWLDIDKNFRKLCAIKKEDLSIGISAVAQVYNILNLVDLFEYAAEVSKETGRYIHFDILHSYRPRFLDYGILPKAIQQKAAKRLLKFCESSSYFESDHHRAGSLRDGVQALIRRLESPSVEENPEMIAKLITYTNTLDKKRKEAFNITCAELSEELKAFGYQSRPEINL